MQATMNIRLTSRLEGPEDLAVKSSMPEPSPEFASLLTDMPAKKIEQDASEIKHDIEETEQDELTASVGTSSSDTMPVLCQLGLLDLVTPPVKNTPKVAGEPAPDGKTQTTSQSSPVSAISSENIHQSLDPMAKEISRPPVKIGDDQGVVSRDLKSDAPEKVASAKCKQAEGTSLEFPFGDHRAENSNEAAKQDPMPVSSTSEAKPVLAVAADASRAPVSVNSTTVPPSPVQQLLTRIEMMVKPPVRQSNPAVIHIQTDQRVFSKPGDLRMIRMTLMPEELGHVDVTLRRTGSGLRVHIAVATETAAKALQADLGLLKDRLGDLVTGLPPAAVDIGLRDQFSTAPRDVSQQTLSQESPGYSGGAAAGMGRRSSPDRNESPFQASRDEHDEDQTSANSSSVGIVL